MLKTMLDWSQLPSDLLGLIVGRLDEISDYLRLRSVCVRWRSISIPQNLLPKQRIPWLLYPSIKRDGLLHTFSFSESKTYAIPVPELRNSQVFSSSGADGWLVAIRRRAVGTFNVWLLNPLTRSPVVKVPALIWPTPDSPRRFCIRRIFDGKEDEDAAFTVCCAASKMPSVFVWRSGRAGWIQIDTRGESNSMLSTAAMVIHNNRLLLSRWVGRGRTQIFDLETWEKVLDTGASPCTHSGYVESSGELLAVQTCRDKFQVLCLNGLVEGEGTLHWEEVTCTEDTAFFLDGNSCFLANSFKGCKGSCIYCLEVFKGSTSLVTVEIGEGDGGQHHSFADLSEPMKGWDAAWWFIPSLQ